MRASPDQPAPDPRTGIGARGARRRAISAHARAGATASWGADGRNPGVRGVPHKGGGLAVVRVAALRLLTDTSERAAPTRA